MKLSVIIVNYNVKFFLEQCLHSVRKAAEQLAIQNPEYKSEIIVVDNNSVDSSIKMLKERFNDVHLILNKDNKGFSAANNQAIRIAKGEYILLLNPDTVVEESTFRKTIDFMDKNNDAGGLGVKMIDGKGNFLPESKRGFPTPLIAFYKIFGFSKLFPRSKTFGRYHLGFLDPDKINEVNVLAGAFMMLRKSVLNKIGLLDESFFMYGEDIDLSYRIKLAGYKNYYFPETRIIHYKGESTSKSSVNYVLVFYKAMIIFAKKHFNKKNASLFSFILHIAIYLRAGGAIGHRFFKKSFLYILDIILIYSGLLLIKIFWENVKFGHGGDYPRELILYLFPAFTILWMLGLLLLNGYSKPFKISKIIKGVLLGTVFISTIYAFLEESYRFSRALIIFGSISSFMAILFTRLLFQLFEFKKFNLSFGNVNRIAIVGDPVESKRVLSILNKSDLSFILTGFISPANNLKAKDYIGQLGQLDEIIEIFKINELIFCSKDIPAYQIINQMARIKNKEITYKIAPRESLYVIGSNHKNQTGVFYTIDVELSILKFENKLNKRILDIVASLLILIFSPIFIFFQKQKLNFIKNVFEVFIGVKTWVSYSEDKENQFLPKIKKGVLCTSDQHNSMNLDSEQIAKINIAYAKDYQLFTDIKIIFRALTSFGK